MTLSIASSQRNNKKDISHLHMKTCIGAYSIFSALLAHTGIHWKVDRSGASHE